MDQSPHSRSDDPWYSYCTCVVIKPIGAALNANIFTWVLGFYRYLLHLQFWAVHDFQLCCFFVLLLAPFWNQAFPHSHSQSVKWPPKCHKNWQKGGYPGSRITSRSNTSFPNKPWADCAIPQSHSPWPQTHSLPARVSWLAATEAQADKTWWMQIVCAVTDSFVYSGMVSWRGAPARKLYWEEGGESDGSSRRGLEE